MLKMKDPKTVVRKVIGVVRSLYSSNAKFKYFLYLFMFTFTVFLPLSLHHVQHSAYYTCRSSSDELLDQAKTLNDLQLRKASDLLFSQKKVKQDFVENFTQRKQKVDINIAIIATTRYVDEYDSRFLTQIVAKFLAIGKSALQNDITFRLFVCSVDDNPHNFKELHNLTEYVPIVAQHTTRYFSINHILEMEKKDYVFCLIQAGQFGKTDYVLLIEDDALPKDNLFDNLAFVLKYHLNSTHGDEENKQNTQRSTAFVKFYHPDMFLGYLQGQPQRLAELLAFTLLLSFITSQIHSTFVTKTTSHITTLLYTLYFLCVLLAIGRPNVNQIRSISPYLHSFGSSPDCCTQALLFPVSKITQISRFMMSKIGRKDYAKDSILGDYLQESNDRAFIFEPNSFTHIGFYSALRKRFVNPWRL